MGSSALPLLLPLPVVGEVVAAIDCAPPSAEVSLVAPSLTEGCSLPVVAEPDPEVALPEPEVDEPDPDPEDDPDPEPLVADPLGVAIISARASGSPTPVASTGRNCICEEALIASSCSALRVPGTETTMFESPWVVTSAPVVPWASTRWVMMSRACSSWSAFTVSPSPTRGSSTIWVPPARSRPRRGVQAASLRVVPNPRIPTRTSTAAKNSSRVRRAASRRLGVATFVLAISRAPGRRHARRCRCGPRRPRRSARHARHAAWSRRPAGRRRARRRPGGRR